MIRFIFYTLIAYVLYKIFRVFIDPMFETTQKQGTPSIHNSTNQQAPKSKEPTLGEYVEYEEVK